MIIRQSWHGGPEQAYKHQHVPQRTTPTTSHMLLLILFSFGAV
jgi:hypothetical protein